MYTPTPNYYTLTTTKGTGLHPTYTGVKVTPLTPPCRYTGLVWVHVQGTPLHTWVPNHTLLGWYHPTTH